MEKAAAGELLSELGETLERARRMDRWSRVVFPVVFAGLVVWSLML